MTRTWIVHKACGAVSTTAIAMVVLLAPADAAAQECLWCHYCAPKERYLSEWGASTHRIFGHPSTCTPVTEGCSDMGFGCSSLALTEELAPLWERANTGESVSLIEFVRAHPANVQYVAARSMIAVTSECQGSAQLIAAFPVRPDDRDVIQAILSRTRRGEA